MESHGYAAEQFCHRRADPTRCDSGLAFGSSFFSDRGFRRIPDARAAGDCHRAGTETCPEYCLSRFARYGAYGHLCCIYGGFADRLGRATGRLLSDGVHVSGRCVHHGAVAPGRSQRRGTRRGLFGNHRRRSLSAHAFSVVAAIGVRPFTCLFRGPYSALLPAFARDNLGFDASWLGLLQSSGAAGALGASFLACYLGDMRGKGKLLLGASLALMGWGLAPLGTIPAGALADRVGDHGGGRARSVGSHDFCSGHHDQARADANELSASAVGCMDTALVGARPNRSQEVQHA